MPHANNTFELTRLVGSQSAPLELHGTSSRLFVRQIVEVLDGHCQTESYGYRLQAGDAINSWLIRWEYHRHPPRDDYPYTPAHVHVNGAFADGRPTGPLHLPTRRVPLELVIWHLLAEWGVDSRTEDWRHLLAGSIEGFDERRTTS